MTANNKEFTPTVDGKYIPRKVDGIDDMEVFTRAHEHKMNVLLIGETGTGKTHAVRAFCYKNKLPYFPLNLTESTQVEDLVGQMIPDEKGGFKWVDGPLTRFIRYGGVVVVEEINAANAGVLFVLHSILDDQRRLCITQKDGEVIKAHEDFWFVATMNPDYEGTKPLNAALKDRFHVVLYYDYDETIEKQLIKSDEIRKLASKLRPLYRKGELLTPISTRGLMQFEKNIEVFGHDAAVESFLNRFNRDESQSIRGAIEMIFTRRTKNALVEEANEKVGR
jgi:MoxR-like ATPase